MKRWLSIKEAAEYSKLGRHKLKGLASIGIIKGCPDPDNKRGDWIFDRESLDSYRESQMAQPSARDRALAILKGNRI